MNNSNWKSKLMGGMVAALMMTGCGGQQQQTPVDVPASREDVIRSVQSLPEPKEQAVTAVDAGTDGVERYSDGSEWRCTSQKFSAAEAPADIVTLEPNPAVIWPGSLLQGETLESGAPEPVAVKRGGGTVLMNLVNSGGGVGAKSYQVKLDEMTQGNVIDAQNSILSNNVGSTPAAFTFESQRVDSAEELALAMHANVGWTTGSVDASLKFKTDKRYTRYLLKLTQRYYTMVYQTPTSLDEVFAPSVTAEDLARYVRPGNPATYISSVTYGRQFYLLFESTASAQELEASLKFVYEGGVYSASVDAQASYKKTQSETSLKAFAIGGGAAEALQGVFAAEGQQFDKLREFIAKGADFSASNPGLPLSYTVRNVSDNKLVKVGIATEFVKKSCVPVVKNDARVAMWLDASSLTANDGQKITYWPGKTVAQNDGKNGFAWYRTDGINGRPAMFFARDGAVSGLPWANLKVDLGTLVNSNHTIISVTRLVGETGPGRNLNLFLQGTGITERSNLHLGYETGMVIFGHHTSDLRAQALPSTNGDVMSFTFDQNAGKRIDMNGVLRGTDANKSVLLSNLGSRIGGGGFGDIGYFGMVGEVRAYSYALSKAERKVVECELGQKWGIGVEGCVDGKPDPALMSY